MNDTTKGANDVQRRHESPDLGDAIVRMMRGLVTRAAEGDQEALEQLARIEQLAPAATTLGMQLAHDGRAGYSFTELARVLGCSRQAARQRVERGTASYTIATDVHQLAPGHSKRTCATCKGVAA